MFRVYLQMRRYDIFIDTGVNEVNPAQKANWQEICERYGYYTFRFIPIEGNYRLNVPKRSYRKRCKKKPKVSK